MFYDEPRIMHNMERYFNDSKIFVTFNLDISLKYYGYYSSQFFSFNMLNVLIKKNQNKFLLK